jgi:cytochrome c-type biogenesis protein CcmH
VLRKYLFAGFLAIASTTQAADTRLAELGNKLICMCGCRQLLGGCTMINCPKSEPMRKELRGYVEQGLTDKQVLATFVDKYGTKVLSAPPTSDWFNLSAWVMPFLALLAGGVVVVYFLRSRRPAPPVAEGAPAPVDTLKYQAEIEEELRNLTPED